MKYTKPRNSKSESRHLSGRFKAGLLSPVMATAVRGSESMLLNQSVTFELDPIPGRLLTEMFAEVVAVFVPLQAIDELKNPTDTYPGTAEAMRQKLMSGTPPFTTEAENEISKRLGIVPRSVSGTKEVSEVGRLAYIAAVNHLRQRRYVEATLLDATANTVSPAVLSKTVLDRLNGVLDPETRVNGAVNFASTMYVKTDVAAGTAVAVESTVTADNRDLNAGGPSLTVGGGAALPDANRLYAELNNGSISLSDFYQAEKMDALTREMRSIMDQNPTHGETLIQRWAYGLSVDLGKHCVVVGERQVPVNRMIDRATDFANLGKHITEGAVEVGFNTVIPATEFGGVVVTMATLRPDETLAEQPHPILSKAWTQPNHAADEMAIDPIPVTVRDLYADCATLDEGNIALYVGNNHLEKEYIHYGFNRHVNPTTVDSETAIWQIEVPMSVTPDNVLYPADLNQDPFADTTAEVVTYSAKSQATIATPMIFGPTPVEDLNIIDDANVFEEV